MVGERKRKSLSQVPEMRGSSSWESSTGIREILEFTDMQPLPLISDVSIRAFREPSQWYQRNAGVYRDPASTDVWDLWEPILERKLSLFRYKTYVGAHSRVQTVVIQLDKLSVGVYPGAATSIGALDL